jgi:hypothetical protein
VSAGVDLVDGRCSEFFDSLVRLQHDADFARTGVVTANTQTAAILGALEASSSAIAIIAAASQFATNMIDSYTQAYAFAPYAVEARRLVMEAMDKFKSSIEFSAAISSLNTLPTSSDSYCAAQNIVRNYARLCTISGIEDLTRQAISEGRIVKRGNESSGKGASDADHIPEGVPVSVSPAGIFRVPSFVVK